ncbi:MAG: YIP1 family protein [Acidobacteriota bacterium]
MSPESGPESTATESGGPGMAGRLVRSFGRIIGIFFSPVATFREIARAHDWFSPLLLLIILSVGGTYLVSDKLDFQAMFTAQTESLVDQGLLQPEQGKEQVDAQVRFWDSWGMLVTQISIVVFTPLAVLALALVFWVGTNAFGGRITFGITCSVLSYAFWAKGLEGLLRTVVLMGKEAVRADLVPRVLLTNPQAFMPESAAGTALYSLAGNLNLFNLWFMALVAVGLSEAGNLSRGAAAGLVLLLYGVWVGAAAGLAVLF